MMTCFDGHSRISQDGKTPLHIAMENSRVEYVKALLQLEGIDVKAQDKVSPIMTLLVHQITLFSG